MQTKRPRGHVTLFHRGQLLWETHNLVVNSGLTALANLLGGTTAGEFVAAIGYGSSGTAPLVTDTTLNANPTYYKAIGTITIGPSGGVAAGSVQFAYSLLTTDYAANPLTIQELGLFGNTGAITMPAAVGTTFNAWAASTGYVIGNIIVDSNSNIQRCTTSGTSQSPTHPSWSVNVGSTTTENVGTTNVPVWTLVALHTAPTPLISHVIVPSFPYTGAGNFSGTWTIAM